MVIFGPRGQPDQAAILVFGAGAFVWLCGRLVLQRLHGFPILPAPSVKLCKLLQIIGGTFFVLGFGGCIGSILHTPSDPELATFGSWVAYIGAAVWILGKTGRWWRRTES